MAAVATMNAKAVTTATSFSAAFGASNADAAAAKAARKRKSGRRSSPVFVASWTTLLVLLGVSLVVVVLPSFQRRPVEAVPAVEGEFATDSASAVAASSYRYYGGDSSRRDGDGNGPAVASNDAAKAERTTRRRSRTRRTTAAATTTVTETTTVKGVAAGAATTAASSIGGSDRRRRRRLRNGDSVGDDGDLFAEIDLPFGDVNVLVVTDVHSWIGRRPRNVTAAAGGGGGGAGSAAAVAAAEAAGDSFDKYAYDALPADYGDVLSFYRQLKRYADERLEKDLFFVMNGDFVDGTGLSTVPPDRLTPLLQRMPWDAVNMGNHELYHDETVEFLTQPDGFVQHWNGTYLTSNTLLNATRQPIGRRYTYLKGRHSNSTILTFGFLYNFENNCPSTIVERVEDVVQRQSWFRDVLRLRNYDAVLVLAHMDCVDPLVYTILRGVRNHVAEADMADGFQDRRNIPIQFITGHSHRRAFELLVDEEQDKSGGGFNGNENDAAPMAASFEAGHFLDTVGFISFPLSSSSSFKARGDGGSNSTSQFRHVFLDATKHALNATLGGRYGPLGTPEGRELSQLIRQTQQELGLDRVLGVAPETFLLEGEIDDPDSLWGLYLSQIIPTQLLGRYNRSRIFVQRTAALRYSLYEGPVTVDDVIAVCPFNDTVYRISDSLPGSVLRRALGEFAVATTGVMPYGTFPSVGIAPLHVEIDRRRKYALYVPEFHVREMTARLENATGGRTAYHPAAATAHDGSVYKTTNLWRDFVLHEWSPPQATMLPPIVSRTTRATTVGHGVVQNGDESYHRNVESLGIAVIVLVCAFFCMYQCDFRLPSPTASSSSTIKQHESSAAEGETIALSATADDSSTGSPPTAYGTVGVT